MINISEHAHQRLKAFCLNEGLSVDDVASKAIEDYIARKSQQRGNALKVTKLAIVRFSTCPDELKQQFL